MKIQHLFRILFLFVFVTTSCTKNNQNGIAIPLSVTSDSILKDTTSFNLAYDSIKKALLSSTNDSTQLELLIELSGKNKKITLPLIEDAIAYCDKTDNKYALAEAFSTKGNYFIHQSEFDTAQYYLDKSKSLAQQLGSSKLMAKVIFSFGEMDYQQDKDSEAIVEYGNCLKMAESIQDQKMTAYAMSGIGEAYRMTDDNAKAIEYFNRALRLTKKIGDKSRTAFCLSSMAEVYRVQGDNKHAEEFYTKALKMAEEAQDKGMISFCLSTMGSMYTLTSEYEKALANYAAAIKIAKETNSKSRIAFCLSSIGEIYRVQNDYAKSLEYYNQTLPLTEEIDDKSLMAFCYSSIGEIYRAIGDFPTAQTNFYHAIKIAKEIDDKSRVTFCYNTLGEMYLSIGDSARKAGNPKLENENYDLGIAKLDTAIKLSEIYEDKIRIADCNSSKGEIYSKNAVHKGDAYFTKALDCYTKSLTLGEELENWSRVSLTLSCMGNLYLSVNDPFTAKMYALKSLTASKKSAAAGNISASAQVLYQAYEKTGDYKNALEMHKLFKQMSDSLTNADNIKRFAATEYKAKEEKLQGEKTKQAVVFKAEQIKKDAELTKQRAVRNGFMIGFGLVLILAFVIFRSLQANRKAKKIIETKKAETEFQKALIEEKQKEILDSITYARRIQRSLLPTEKYIDRTLKRLMKK